MAQQGEVILYSNRMPFGVTKNNWSIMVELAIERVRNAAAAAPRDSLEEAVLRHESQLLEKMRDQVRHCPPSHREPIASELLAVSVREELSVGKDLIEFDGAVFDVYRRWRQQLQ